MNGIFNKELVALTNYHVPHSALMEADQTIRQTLMSPGGTDVVLVVGPPGVGKTTLAALCQLNDLCGTGVPVGTHSPPTRSATSTPTHSNGPPLRLCLTEAYFS
jgi:hypothetical protein